MEWFDPAKLDTINYIDALAAALGKYSKPLADRVNVLVATAREKNSSLAPLTGL